MTAVGLSPWHIARFAVLALRSHELLLWLCWESVASPLLSRAGQRRATMLFYEKASSKKPDEGLVHALDSALQAIFPNMREKRSGRHHHRSCQHEACEMLFQWCPGRPIVHVSVRFAAPQPGANCGKCSSRTRHTCCVKGKGQPGLSPSLVNSDICPKLT